VKRAYEVKRQKQPVSFAWIGPAVLAVFVYAGQLKASPLLSWLPIDNLTIAASAAGVVAFALARAKNGPGTWTIALPLLLWLVFFLGIYQASWDSYTDTKIQTLYTFTLFAVLAPFHLLRFPAQRKAFLVTLGIFSVAAGALTLAGGSCTRTTCSLKCSMRLGGSRAER
jgi:hypothetical protein